uniref:Uncharacterized protein n=1 Tax=Meloidogyne javanica TaxID=6303 RepID=A0A915M2P7_MELJA
MKSNSSKLLNVSDCYDRKPSSHQQNTFTSNHYLAPLRRSSSLQFPKTNLSFIESALDSLKNSSTSIYASTLSAAGLLNGIGLDGLRSITVQWPQLPASGTHSKQARKKKMARERKAGSEQLIREFNVAVCPKEQPTPYSVRAMTMERAYSQFEKRQLRHFFIYYQLSSQSFKDVNKIPLELPLMIAYKSDTGNVVHSQIKRFVSKENNNNDNKDNAELWCAIPYDSNGNPVAEPYHLG